MIKSTVMRQSHYYYEKHLKEIKRIKTIEQIEIITKKVENAFGTHRISYEECEDLMTRLSSKASNIGEKKRVLKLGPLGEFGGEKKGAI